MKFMRSLINFNCIKKNQIYKVEDIDDHHFKVINKYCSLGYDIKFKSGSIDLTLDNIIIKKENFTEIKNQIVECTYGIYPTLIMGNYYELSDKSNFWRDNYVFIKGEDNLEFPVSFFKFARMKYKYVQELNLDLSNRKIIPFNVIKSEKHKNQAMYWEWMKSFINFMDDYGNIDLKDLDIDMDDFMDYNDDDEDDDDDDDDDDEVEFL